MKISVKVSSIWLEMADLVTERRGQGREELQRGRPIKRHNLGKKL